MAKTDYIAELGAQALASRLRRLLQLLHRDGEQVYRSLNLDFKPKWFPVLHLLSTRSPLTLTEIARLLSVAHPSSIETVDELISAGLINSRKSDIDGRRRELSLTDRGKQLRRELLPVWDAFRVAGEAAIKEGENDFLGAVDKLERSLLKQSMYERIMAQLEKRTRQQEKRASSNS
jgi:DNA-binding MarR family transcriptional regulator